jgi:hypothetical protein
MNRAHLFHIEMPMSRPFDHSGAERSRASNLFLKIQNGALSGLGECVPRSYVTRETPATVFEDIMPLDLNVVFKEIDADQFDRVIDKLDHLHIPRLLNAHKENKNAAACLMETALLDYYCNRFETHFGFIVQNRCPDLFLKNGKPDLPISSVVDFSMDIDDFLEKKQILHFCKIKVGRNFEQDMKRVRQLRSKIGPRIPIALDANLAWNLEQALEFARNVSASDIFCFEEPLITGSWDDLRIFRFKSGQKVMLDETCCSLEHLRSAWDSQACDFVNLRLSKCGGVLLLLKMADFCFKNKIGFQLGVQVGEIGPLWSISRQIASVLKEYLILEAGQADRWFPNQIVAPPHYVDRTHNTVKALAGPGHGIRFDSNYAPYVKRQATWKQETQWQELKGLFDPE